MPSFPQLLIPTTSGAIRDQMISILEALTPGALPEKYKRYRGEGDGNFKRWVSSQPDAGFRRFQIREVGTHVPPSITNTDVEEDTATFQIIVAYPQSARFGAKQSLSRDDVITADRIQLEREIGMAARAHFSPPFPDACWRSSSSTTDRSGPLDLLIITQTMSYRVQVGFVTQASAAFQGIVIWGQSSAIGRGNVNTLVGTAVPAWTATFPGVTLKQLEGTHVDPPVTVYDDTRVLQPRTWNDAGVNMGIELSLGRYLFAVAPNISCLIKYGIGATGLQEGFTPSSTYPSTGGNALARSFDYFDVGRGQLNCSVACGAFLGCETDALTTGPANAVNANLTAMLAAFRARFGANAPFVFNRLTSALPIGTYPFRDTVISQQNAFFTANTGNKVAMVIGDDLAIDSGSHEYVGDSYLALGNRFGLAILGLLGINILPVANWSVGTASLVATFTDLSSDADGTIVAWAWSFGDTNTSTAQNPVHTYAAPGTYTVALTVTDNVGGQNTYQQGVSVSNPTWTIDATSNKGMPATTTEWNSLISSNSLTIPAPSHLWIFNAASGNITDVIGGKTLTAGGSPGYHQNVTGWASFFVGPSGAASNQTFLNAAMQNVNAHSSWVLGYCLFNQTAQNMQRMFHGGSDNNSFESAAGTKKMRLRTGANAGNSTLDHDSVVRPINMGVDLTNSLNVIWSDIERKQITFATPASGTNFEVQTGISLDTAAIHQVCMAVQWEDFCPTDAQVKATLQALGWTVSGY